MHKKIIIGLVGPLSSGKGTTASYLESKYGATTHKFSTMLRDVLSRLCTEITRENMQGLSTILRKQFGEDLMAKVIAEDAKKDKNKIVVVDGVRRLADIKYLREMENFILIKIDADPKLRHTRLMSRDENEDDANKTYEQFLEDHKKEADAEIPTVMKSADEEINNDGSLEDLQSAIENIINKYLNK